MTEDTSLEDRLATARAQNPKRRLYVADSPAGMLILGKPNRAQHTAYVALIMGDPADKAKAPTAMLLACAVDPDPKAMIDVLEEFPALAWNSEVQHALGQCMGTLKADTEKK